jgi:hypothetical protein
VPIDVGQRRVCCERSFATDVRFAYWYVITSQQFGAFHELMGWLLFQVAT